ncbi:MAG: MoxR family ATPase [Sulfurovum sp.]|nr:MoxR family ATPase [Sulfurovum sp.]
MNKIIERLKQEISKAVIGQEEMINALLIGLLCNGHILIEGVPGLAKTTTINALSNAIELDAKRIQFTPDLLPSDIIGTQIYNPKNHDFSIKKGPIFTHLLLADEINRAPAKVQSALLEAMQERQVTIGDESFNLEAPFLVMATQNPIEQEGVYRLPEAQLDRFMMKIIVKHNSEEEELHIMRKSAQKGFDRVEKVLSIEDLFSLQKELDNIHIDEELERYMVQLISATRDPKHYGLSNISESIMFGVSPRGSIDLYKASRAQAFLKDKSFVSPSDISEVIHKVLRHRIVLSYEARAEGITSDELISTLVETLPIP